jgi:hypothetical protein
MKNVTKSTRDALRRLIAADGGAEALKTPGGYPHMGVIILDAVYSLQANYDSTVVPLLQRYCEAVPGLSWPLPEGRRPEHTAQDLIDFLTTLDIEARLDLLNRQLAPGTSRSRKGPVLKVDAAIAVAKTLLAEGISTRDDFVQRAHEPHVEKKVRDLPGIGIACWRYLLNLSGAENVKPDTMILRWLNGTLGEQHSPKAAAKIIEDATALLQGEGIHVTVRQIDHLIWRTQSEKSRQA